MIYKRELGHYYIFNNNEIVTEYACSSKKRPENACKHFARLKFKQIKKPIFTITFIKDTKENKTNIILYTYKCNITLFTPTDKNDKYQQMKKYNIKVKQIRKENMQFGNLLD